MSLVDDAKKVRRADMRRIRAAIPDRERRTDELWRRVIRECRTVDAHRVMAYVGTGTEPDTAHLLEWLGADGFEVALPRVEGDRIVAVIHGPGLAMTVGAYGIAAPSGPAIDPLTIDVVVVPGLAFTRDGRRLGQGGGFYDRFLPLLRVDCLTIGACFAEQFVDDLVVDAHDRNVGRVVTDAVAE